MGEKSLAKKMGAGLLAAVVLLLTVAVNGVAAVVNDPVPDTQNERTVLETADSYAAYLAQFGKSFSLSAASFAIDLSAFSSPDGNATPDSENTGAVVLSESGSTEWSFTAEQEGFYNITVKYLPTAGKGVAAVRQLLIDGVLPFSQCRNLQFCRCFANETEITVNEQGDQIRPSQVESPMWLETPLTDASGYYSSPLCFYLKAGEHTLTLRAVKEPLTVGAITFGDATTLPAYETVAKEYAKKGYKEARETVKIEGEAAIRKSDSTLYPVADVGSCAVSPSSEKNLMLNTVGGSKWQTCGQWLEWDFKVKESGLYRLSFAAKQDVLAGQPSSRKIYIDGKIPFAEAADVRFEYDTVYRMTTLGGDQPNLIYLDAGTHTLRMEAAIGSFSSVAGRMDEIVIALNAIYRKMLMLMSTSPDVNRDYQLEELIPETLEELKVQTKKLSALKKDYAALTGQSGAQYQTLADAVQLLEKMCRRTDKIPKWFQNFADTVTALGNWLVTARSQPLQLDYILLDPAAAPLPTLKAGFCKQLVFSAKKFFYSFAKDYAPADASRESVTVWVTTGRDQSTALNQMIKNQFEPTHDIGVKLQLVPAGTLLMAELAGRGPDVAMGISQTSTIDYAIRQAVTDLSEFDGADTVRARFLESACEPVSYRGAWYGLPETQTFFVMIYREDILNDLSLSVPETWDDLLEMLPVLSENNMTVGLPPVLQSYAMFLYQLGGSLYNKDQTACLVDSAEGIAAFDRWVKLYTEYGLPVEYDFPTRFRSGEMPIGIIDYGTLNAISAFAPELEGLFTIAKVPGTVRSDGTVNHATPSVVTATVMMRHSEHKNAAWQFMDWWSTAAVQTKYAGELESILGTTGRYQPANVESLYNIPWDTRSFNMLMDQWQYTAAIPEIPGSYMTARYLDFAYKRYVVNTDENAYMQDVGQIMIDTAFSVNAELAAKLKEFSLSNKR